MHQREIVQRALRLAAAGQNACEISRTLGVPRRTIADWLRKGGPGHRHPRRLETPDVESLVMGCEPDYAYLLGLYLGDGHISEMNKGTFRLRITLDSRYPRIIDGAAGAIDGLLPAQRVGKYPHPTANLVTVASYSWRWLYLLPQHGPGLKHSREIRLHDWQRPIVDAHPRWFVRGLLHSDGCRFHAHQTTRGRTYSYARYAFVNTSSDILSLFCEYLDVLGIAWTRATRHTIQIARREAVARLDEFVGPKQ